MKNHNGMRPQDIVILLKIATLKNKPWFIKDLAFELNISQSETSESLHRSKWAGLVGEDKKKLMKRALLEFLEHGLQYVYPQRPGAIVRGKPTAHSAPPLDKLIQSDEVYVWPSANGEERGQAIEPLHKGVVVATEKDMALYELLALTDALRVGKVRERQLAMKELKKRIL
jgi:predicted transcriptional regulator